eukprot:scaffold489_cov259-Pinguiococcus_pyrenoidosus.AAC.25
MEIEIQVLGDWGIGSTRVPERCGDHQAPQQYSIPSVWWRQTHVLAWLWSRELWEQVLSRS